MIPKYLRPVFDRKEYGPVPATEKVVRLAVFGPVLFVLFLPAIVCIILFAASLGGVIAPLMNSDQHGMNLVRFGVFVIVPMMFVTGLGVRKFFFPFD